MKVVLAVTADFVNESSDHKINVIGIFTQFPWIGQETFVPQFFLLGVLEAEEADYETEHALEFAVKTPDGKDLIPPLLFHTTVPGAPPQGRLQLNQSVNLTGVFFAQPGTYSFDISVDGQLARSTPLDLIDEAREDEL
jgi:hypothetical protein